MKKNKEFTYKQRYKSEYLLRIRTMQQITILKTNTAVSQFNFTNILKIV